MEKTNYREIRDSQTLTREQKDANDKKWYKDYIKMLDKEGVHSATGFGGISEYKRQKTNFDLYNNILDNDDFEYVCKPFGAEAGELPASMVNRDISSPRIKALEGMEMKRPFSWKALAVNRDATTRKETEEFGRIRDYVIGEIMRPIREGVMSKYAEELKGDNLTDDERAKVQEQIAQEINFATPDKVRQYMQRKHQDPAEVQAHQIIEYLTQEQELKRKFSKAWKYGCLSAKPIFWVGSLNGRPQVRNVNPIRFNYDKGPDEEFIEDGEWATAEYRMSPSEVVRMFREDLTKEEINRIYTDYTYYATEGHTERLFDFSKDNEDMYDGEYNTIRVLHANWKALREIGVLTYIDPQTQKEEKMLVDEGYKLDFAHGDIDIEWYWVPETYEGYRIGDDIWAKLRPVPGQFKTVNDLDRCRLSYHGVVFDNMNSQPTAPMDRLKPFQYYHNIVMYRAEILLASDKGKKILMNINNIPESAGIDVETWQYYFETTPFMWYNPNEGAGYADVNTVAKQIDMSLVSDITKYIEMARFLDERAGQALGVTGSVLGDVATSAEVGNTRHELQQKNTILEPYFDMFNHCKARVLNSLLDIAKITWMNNDPGTLSYVLDDMSTHLFNVDANLLASSDIGIFVTNSSDSAETKEAIRQLAHAAMQNQVVELSDIAKVIRQKGSQEAEEILVAAENRKREEARADAQAERENNLKIAREKQAWEREKMNTEHQHNIKEIREKGKIDLQKQAMLSIGFNEDKDVDNDGQLDVVELYKAGKDANIKARKQALDEAKFEEEKRKNREDEKIKKEDQQIKKKQAKKSANSK